MLTVEYIQNVYNYLEEKWEQYSTRPQERHQIEQIVRLYSHNLDDDLYLRLNEGRASGLFEHGFFEVDLQRALAKLLELQNSISDTEE